MIDAHGDPRNSYRGKGFLYDKQYFEIACRAVAPDRIDVALNEFAVAARLRFFAAPHFCDVITLKRKIQFAFVFRRKARKRNG